MMLGYTASFVVILEGQDYSASYYLNNHHAYIHKHRGICISSRYLASGL